MRRTELLQELRKMRFEEAYGGWRHGRLTQSEAVSINSWNIVLGSAARENSKK